MPTKPTNHTVWVTDGDTNKQVQPMSGKQLLGWVVNDKPPFQTWNWLHWNAWQWETYFEQITDLHTTQIAALTTSVGTLSNASGITAATAGHTTATGGNVQLQLDELDTAIKNIEDAVTGGMGIDLVGYVPAAPSNWSPAPTHAGPALDQLALRTKALENAGAGQDFLQQSLSDYVIDADKPISGFPSGIGNPGLTDNSFTNPRGIKISELQVTRGEERIYFHSLKETGKYDAAGLQEWEVTAPHRDIRVRLYGAWSNSEDVSPGAYIDGEAVNKGQYFRSLDPNSYMLVTGVCDGIALMGVAIQNSSNQIQVEVDGVNTGAPISQRGSTILQNAHGNVDQMFGDVSLTNLGYGLHTFKFANGTTDANIGIRLQGVVLITTGVKELGGAMYLSKALLTLSPATISSPSVGGKGAKIIRYVDPADSTRKDAFQNTLEVNTAVTGSVGSGTTSLGVNNSTGIPANSIVEITDGPTNSELILVNSNNTFSNVLTLASPGTVNSYTNPTVKLYAKVMAGTDHSNEQEKWTQHAQSFSVGQRDIQASDQPAWIGTFTGFNVIQGQTQDGVYGLVASSGRVISQSGGQYYSSFTTNGYTNVLHFEFNGSGCDILFDPGTADTSTYDVYLDGVKISTMVYVTPQSHAKWFKFCSDLPMGSHKLSFYSSVNLATNGQQGFVAFKVYEAKDPAAIAGISRGDLLSKRIQIANYLYNPHYNFPSKGVIKQHAWQNTFFGNVNPANTTFGWTGSTYDVNNGLGGAPDFIELDTATTDDVVRKWFYCGPNGGIEVLTLKVSNQGISEYKIDGNLATAANFPGMTFQGGGGSYNTATGLFDGYDVSSTNIYQKLSFAGLSEGWHELQIRCTGTKNVSSSNFYMFLHGFYIINGCFSDDVFSQSTVMTNNISLGGAKDLRLREVNSFTEQDTPVSVSGQNGTVSYGTATNITYPILNGFGCVESHGGDLEIQVHGTATLTAAGQLVSLLIEVDGRLKGYTQIHIPGGSYYVATNHKVRVPCPPGRHFIKCGLSGTGGAITAVNTAVSIKELPRRRAL